VWLTTPSIYTTARVLYSRVMPPERTGKRSYTTQVSRREADLVEAERARRGERHVSAVVEAALRGLLAGMAAGASPLEVPSALGEEMVTVTYRLCPETIGLLRAASRSHRFQAQQIVRAAIHALGPGADGPQGPTQTGAYAPHRSRARTGPR
jgi:hypothetical protein